MKYWWVNHKQTVRQEIDGQYLWSPKRETRKAGGSKRSQFYDNMRLASPGDLVLSYANGLIAWVGRVAEFAFTAPKPKEFEKTGGYWSEIGWFLPVFWTPITPPVSPKAMLDRIGPMLPTRHKPYLLTGRGSQKAYLAEISVDLFDAVITGLEVNRHALAVGGANSLTFEVVNDILETAVEKQIQADPNLLATVKTSVIEARRGQGKFRRNVERIEGACRLTGITNPALLIASHIKPWRLCETAVERLDGMNGLMLTPDADLLFDRGFISFEDDGAVKVSPRVDGDDLRRLGFEQLAWLGSGVEEASAAWRTESFGAERRGYLEYHRAEVFIS